MKIWGIADTHLADNRPDIMNYHGEIWAEHREKIIENWHSSVGNDDTILIGGDITWATNMEKALLDINMLGRLPGRNKIIIKGNHDVWWRTYSDVCNMMPKSMSPLSGNAVLVDDHAFCGTMGWLAPNDPGFDGLDMNFFRKEMALLKKALDEAVKLEPLNGLHVLLHFPPFTTQGQETPFYDLISKYPVTTCTFGHFHMPAEWKSVPQGNINGVEFRLISTDFLCHKPYLIWEG